nr:hypothetical protein [Tanacetum cinerariifolium]
MDFINAHTIHYALMVNPTIYVSCIKQFWATATVKKVNDIVQLHALIDGKKVVVLEAIIIKDLHLDDADGVRCLPNEEIFEELARMGYEKPPLKLKFYKAYSMASAIICLAAGRKFNFSKYIFDRMVRNVDSPSVETPLFASMLVQPQSQAKEEVEEDASKQGKIAAIDADEGIALVDVETNKETLIKLKAENAKLLNEQITQKLYDEEVQKVTARDKQERADMEIAIELQKYYKMEFFRGMTYDKFKPIFEREYKKVQTLFKPYKDVQEPKKKRVADETLLQESFKKLRATEVSGSESTQEIPSNDPKEMTEEDVQNMLEIVLVPEFKVEVLYVKYPIIDWKIHTEVKKVNDIVQLHALIDGKKVVVFEAIIIKDLHLDDANRVRCLPNEEIFEELARMGYEKPPPKLKFYKAYSMASAIICLAAGVETPLFASMLVQPQSQAKEEVEVPIAPSPTTLQDPTPTPYATPLQDQPSTPYASSPQEQPTTTSESSMPLLTTLMETCATLS